MEEFDGKHRHSLTLYARLTLDTWSAGDGRHRSQTHVYISAHTEDQQKEFSLRCAGGGEEYV